MVEEPPPGGNYLELDATFKVVAEGNDTVQLPVRTAVEFHLTYRGNKTDPFTANWETVDDTATSLGIFADYEAAQGNFGFTGCPDENKILTVYVLADTITELDEQFKVLIDSTLDESTLTGTVEISNDDQAIINIRLKTGEDGQANEGSEIDYTIELIGEVDVSVDVNWQIDLIDAEVEDFLGNTVQGSTWVNNGAPQRTVSIWAKDDNLVEPDETFYVDIYGIDPHGRDVSIGNNLPSGMIINTDLFAVDVLDDIETEGTNPGSTFNYTLVVKLEKPVEGGVDVEVRTLDYTANAGSDFIGKSEVIHFNEGETQKTFTVQVYGDDDREADEKFTVPVMGWTANFPLPTGTRYNAGNPWALAEIDNDDQGDFDESAGTNRVAFFHGSDPGGTDIANGDHFRYAADYYYDDIFDVSSWDALVAQLETYVQQNGRVDTVPMFL